MASLARLIAAVEEALRLGLTDRASCLGKLGPLYVIRFQLNGLPSDLDFAVNAIEEAVAANHPDIPHLLSTLCIALALRFELTGSMKDLNAAVEAIQNAIIFSSPDDPFVGGFLVNLANVSSLRFERTGSMDDLNSAVNAMNDATALAIESHSDRIRYLNTLGVTLKIRFLRSGSMNDVNAAVRAFGDAVALSRDHSPDSYPSPDQAGLLQNLGNALRDRFERTGSLHDLNEALEAANDAVQMSPENHPGRAQRLSIFAIVLFSRFRRTGSTEDLNSAVTAIQNAIELTPTYCPARLQCLSILGVALRRRFRQGRSMSDLDAAVGMLHEAVTQTPRDDANRAFYLNNYGIAVGNRSEETGSLDDLNSTVAAFEEAVNMTSTDHQDLAGYLCNLGDALKQRFEQLSSLEDFDASTKAYEKAVYLSQSPPTVRIQSARRGAKLIWSQDVKRASQLLTEAVQLLPLTSPRAINRNDHQFTLSQFDDLASDAAALAVRAGEEPSKAVLLLELGRGVIASLHLETRSDIKLLKQQHPELATKFECLRDELDTANPDRLEDSSSDSQRSRLLKTARRYDASKEFDATITAIRMLDGFKDFLLLPSTEELKQIAILGPIVILNASRFGSDSFIITHDGIRHLPLPRLTYEDLEANAKEFLKILEDDKLVPRRVSNISMRKVLEWLWDSAVKSSLEELGLTETPKSKENWPHVWWIPIGLLSLFPIHAAGHHSIPGQNTLDRVISSYTPTVRSLVQARDQIKRQFPGAPQTVLMASMSTTPNKAPLPFAQTEIDAISALLPPTIGRVVLPHPTKLEVTEKLRHCSIAHFACHGEVNESDPSKSQVLLADWETNPLSVADMAAIKLDQVQLAYLSACHAANSRNLHLLDESIHMAGACQFAGFPTAIGTLWQASDKESTTVAERLYSAILTPEGKLDCQKAASGLHFAMRKVKESSKHTYGSRGVDDIMTWAPYIHVGL